VALGGVRRAAWLLLAGALILPMGCAPNYLDPGPNPAKVRVRVEAMSRAGRHYDVVPTWTWGLYGQRPGGGQAFYPPASGKHSPYVTARVLKQDVTFLVPPGKRRALLRLEANMDVPDSEGSRIITVARFEEELNLDLKPGETKIVERRFGF